MLRLLFFVWSFCYLGWSESISFKSGPALVGSNIVATLNCVVSGERDIVIELFYPGWVWMDKFASTTVSTSGDVVLTIVGVTPATYDIKASVRPKGQAPPNGNPSTALTDFTMSGLVFNPPTASISFKSTPSLVGSNLVATLSCIVSGEMDIVLELFHPGWVWMEKYTSTTISSNQDVVLTINNVYPSTYDIKASVRPKGQAPPNGNPASAFTDATQTGLTFPAPPASVAFKTIQPLSSNNELLVVLTTDVPGSVEVVLEIFSPTWTWIDKYSSQTTSTSGDVTLKISGVSSGTYDMKASIRPEGQAPPSGDYLSAYTEAKLLGIGLSTIGVVGFPNSPTQPPTNLPTAPIAPTTPQPTKQPTPPTNPPTNAPVAPTAQVPGSLIDVLATPETVKVWNVLKSLTVSQNFIFGQEFPTDFKKQTGLQPLNSWSSDCKDITGEHPGIFGADLHYIFYKDASEAAVHKAGVIQAYKNGAIITFDFHMYQKGTQSYNGDGSGLIANIINNNGNGDRAWFLGELDRIGNFFKELGFPIIFRPFHEMNGNWFWWGNNPTNYAKLFQLTVTYLKSINVHNLIYCWAPDKTADFNYYPGDQYVDILGLDGYEPGLVSYFTTQNMLDQLGILTDYASQKGKVAAFTEVGARGPSIYNDPGYDFWTKYILTPIINDQKAKKIAYVATWINSNWETPYIPFIGMNQNAVDDFKAFKNHPNTLFLPEVKSLLDSQNSNNNNNAVEMSVPAIQLVLNDAPYQQAVVSEANSKLVSMNVMVDSMSSSYPIEESSQVGIDFVVKLDGTTTVETICANIVGSIKSVLSNTGSISEDRIKCDLKKQVKRAQTQTVQVLIGNPTPQSTSPNELSSGAIAGIVVGSILAVIIVLVIVGTLFWVTNERKKNTESF